MFKNLIILENVVVMGIEQQSQKEEIIKGVVKQRVSNQDVFTPIFILRDINQDDIQPNPKDALMVIGSFNNIPGQGIFLNRPKLSINPEITDNPKYSTCFTILNTNQVQEKGITIIGDNSNAIVSGLFYSQQNAIYSMGFQITQLANIVNNANNVNNPNTTNQTNNQNQNVSQNQQNYNNIIESEGDSQYDQIFLNKATVEKLIDLV